MKLRGRFVFVLFVLGLVPIIFGLSAVFISLDKLIKDEAVQRVVVFSLLGSVAWLTLVCLLFLTRLIRPMREIGTFLQLMALGEGNMSERLNLSRRDEIGELANWFNTYMDKIQQIYRTLASEIDQKRKAQEDVEKSEKYFKALIENTNDVIAVIDSEGRFIFASSSYERVLGYSAINMIGTIIRDQIHPEEKHRWKINFDRMEKQEWTALRFEHRLKHISGEYIDLEITATTYPNDYITGGTVLNMRDVTARKQAQRILREYSEQLERDVAERTMELSSTVEELKATQEQLVLSEKMASLGALTAGIAHEIKNPLNFVNNFADLTTELTQELEEELQKSRGSLPEGDLVFELLSDIQLNARKITEHGKRADSIVKNMLMHSRGKSGERQMTNVNALVDEYVKLTYHGMRASDPSFNIEFDLRFAPDLPQVEAVPQDLSRVFLNIINNGCYAAHERGKRENGQFRPTLSVSTEEQEDRVVVRIRDNGSGIPKEIGDKIFNPFFTTKPAGQGTGLGLSISYDIVVREHKGELRVESEPGEFTEFTIALPKKGCVICPETVQT